MGLFLILIYRCIKIALNAPDHFSMFIATGITGMLTLQVIMNYAVATSSMPVTGVSLPFISYGGTSIMTLLGAIGIMLNISKLVPPCPRQVCPSLVIDLPPLYSQLRPSHSVRFAEIHKDGICLLCVDVTKYTTIYSLIVVFLKYTKESSECQ